MCGAERIEHAIAGLDVTDELDRLATNVRERAFTPREFTDRRGRIQYSYICSIELRVEPSCTRM
jgi:hypothetical protein